MMIYRGVLVPIAVALLGHFVTNGDEGLSTTTHRSVLDHVCYREENFTELEERRVTQPVRIRSHVWCLEFPPRCAHYRTEMKEIIKWQNVTKTRLVEHCCDGYEEVTEANEIICKPICPDGCRRGFCHQPGMCVCNPGCQNGGYCDSKKGECRCQEGWSGEGCELSSTGTSPVSQITPTTPLKLLPVTEIIPKSTPSTIEELNSTLVDLADNIDKLKQQLNTTQTTQSDIALLELHTTLPDIVIAHQEVVPAEDHLVEMGTGSEILVLSNWDLNGTLVKNASDAGKKEKQT
uniref:EMI domain-containing protein n=1 Tax=Lutzomyia longipalpis TaxID=7200 RepID=A0A1B0CG80_LUTLO